jgi:hypothetical protein
VILHKRIILAAFGLLFHFASTGQKKSETNYSAIFSRDYQKALQFIDHNKSYTAVIQSHGLNPKELFAVVFPELIRYNSFQDKIETYTLETLYVQYGKSYSNFSVGEFQIKPAFAEAVEIDFLKQFGEKKLKEGLGISTSDTLQTEASRLKRVKRLKDKAAMINYLCLYLDLMHQRYSSWTSDEEKIKFLASAYNCGYQKSKQEIESFLTKKFFHTGFGVISEKFCYADIAWYYYQH